MPIFLSLEKIQEEVGRPIGECHAHEIERILREKGLIAQSSCYRRFDEVSGMATFSSPGE